ncbi:uncharacterized protein LOC108833078 [Raphanus sativus]|uniref:Uncharacterized protein LOC108833078 n=1 Tax=Raphanus sativus TaxID=3726 RepID=A0A9W3CGN4_RAPSA|nr:uncharacterized protein LOC108833078 [Raphanus sativus]
MDTMKELMALQKPIMLDEGNFGHWKAKMRHIIREIDEDAWTAVEQGWKAPTVIMDDESEEPKPKDKWSDADKAASKFNSKALTTIFSAVDLDQFKIIQGYETIGSFISKLSSIANEASVLGKKYNEKKLVKKLLRCLPPRFEAYKAVLKIAVNTDEMKFDQLAGILKVHDLERVDESSKDQKGVAFSAESKEVERVKKIEENMVLMAKNFNKMLKRVEKGQSRTNQRYQGRDRDRPSQNNRNDSVQGNRRKELQCHECEGFGHYRNECPLTKRKELKCIECKGYGHTRSECPNNLKKDKSLICFSDTESDDESDNEELLLNFSAHVNVTDVSHEPLICYTDAETECEDDHKEHLLNFVARIDQKDESLKSQSSSESDSESEADPEKESTGLKVEYQSLFNKFTELSLENLQLIKDRAMLKAQVNILELEQTENNSDSEKVGSIETEKEDQNTLKRTISEQAYSLKMLETSFVQTKQLLSEELDKSRLLQRELTENYKKLRMLNTGSDTLDHILSLGQSPKINWGLGFQGTTSKTAECNEGIRFVKSSAVIKTVEPDKSKPPRPTSQSVIQKHPVKKRNGCLFCCKPGHMVSNCYFRRKQYQEAWMRNRWHIEPGKFGCVWIAKSDLYLNYKNRISAAPVEMPLPDIPLVTEQRQGKEIMCNLSLTKICDFGTNESVSHTISNESVTDEFLEEDLFENDFSQILGNVAYTTSDSTSQDETPWYFDSGCSRHMTGTADYLVKAQEITGGKVTFGDGGQGKISAIGDTVRADLPRLINVYLVDGLKANLISVSQLCDEGLRVIFDKKECQALDDKNNIVLCGYRSANNCYMWKPTGQCLTAKGSQLEL